MLCCDFKPSISCDQCGFRSFFSVSKSVLLIAEAYVVNTLFGRTIRMDCEGMGDVSGSGGQKVVS